MPHTPAPIPLRVNSATHVGYHHSRNEDCHTIVPESDGVLLAVCDGMGGMGRGDEASRLAVDVLTAHWTAAKGEPAQRMTHALSAADRLVRDALCSNGSERPGSTAVLVHVCGANAHVAWVGDSRAYLVRGGKVATRTRDHKLVEDLIDAGQLSAEQARESSLAHVVTRALGGRAPADPPVQPAALGYPWPLFPGDRLVLCSDGVSDLLEDEEIAEVVDGRPPAAAVSRLVETSLARGGHDNITVIVAAFEGDAPARPAPPAWVAPPTRTPEIAMFPANVGAHQTERAASSPAWVAAGVGFLALAALSAVTALHAIS